MAFYYVDFLRLENDLEDDSIYHVSFNNNEYVLYSGTVIKWFYIKDKSRKTFFRYKTFKKLMEEFKIDEIDFFEFWENATIVKKIERCGDFFYNEPLYFGFRKQSKFKN